MAAKNRADWEDLGGRYDAKAATYPGELAFLRNWSERYAWMNQELMKDPPPLP